MPFDTIYEIRSLYSKGAFYLLLLLLNKEILVDSFWSRLHESVYF
jgi:hypothetical protein